MNFATWSIRNPIPVIVLFVLLTVAGLWSFGRLPIQDLPDIDRPTINIELTQPGATPSQLETEVARPVENALAPLDRLSHLQTTITDGNVAIRVEFALDKPLFEALSEVKEAIDGIRSNLPDDLEEPAISADKIGEDPILVYAVQATAMDEEALSWFLDDTVARRVSKIPGLGQFRRVGGVDREITVTIDPDSAAAVGATPLIVSQALGAMQKQLSGGRGQLGARDQSVRVTGLVSDAKSLEDLALNLPGGGYARLREIGTVQDGARERDEIALLEGRPAIGLKIFPAKGADVTRVASAVEATLAALEAKTPGLRFRKLSGTVEPTRAQYEGSMHMLYEGGALAMLVVLLFLRDLRATLVAAVAFPLSILPVFFGMDLLGFSLNTLTLLALAVTIGILVDDVIVEVENIERHAVAGKPMRQATADAVVEIAVVVLATTLCLVCAFLPTTLMPGVPGLLFKQFGWTAIVAVLCSLLVARMLTPMMAAWLLVPGKGRIEAEGRALRLYLRLVHWCLAHRALTAAAAVLFFVASLLLLPLLPTGLIPASDVGATTVTVELAPGTSMDAAQAKVDEIRAAFKTIAGIDHIFAVVGGESGGTGGDGSKAELLVTFIEPARRPGQAVLEDRIRAVLRDVPGARFSVGSGGLGERVELLLASEDTEALHRAARAIEREMRGVDGLSSVRSSASLERGEIVIRPDTARAAERGIATETIGDTVRIATDGDFDSKVGRLNFDSRQVYLRVRLAQPIRMDPQAFANLRIPGKDGLVPLSSVATIALESGLTRIDRFDRERTLTLSADLGTASRGTMMAAVMALPSVKALPASVAFIEAGENEIASDLLNGFVTALVLGIACVYGVLVVLFKDFFQPITILSAIPFSLGGALALLLVSESELDVPALIGMVMLIGVVTKNSILLVEYAILGIRDGGLSVHDALIDACRKRARPIVMTTVAMIAGMLPVAIGFGADASFRQPMALAVIGGLITSTGLSLLVVPVVFSGVSVARARILGNWRPREDSNLRPTV